jgi:hypothetical protein
MAGIAQNSHSAMAVNLGFTFAYIFLVLAAIWSVGSYRVSNFLKERNPDEHPWDNLSPSAYKRWRAGGILSIMLAFVAGLTVTILFHVDKGSSIAETKPVARQKDVEKDLNPESLKLHDELSVTKNTAPPLPSSPSAAVHHEEPHKSIVALVFKNSPLFTRERKERIQRTIDDYYVYLTSIGFDLPKDLPPFGLMPGNIVIAGGGLGMVTGGVPPPPYVMSMYIPENSVDNQETIRVMYSSNVFSRLMAPIDTVHQEPRSDYMGRVVTIFSCYYRSSFVGKEMCAWKDSPMYYWNVGLWNVRKKIGKDFTDKLLFYAFKMWAVMPEQPSAGFDQFFEHKLRYGYGVIGNPAKDDYAIIREILVTTGVVGLAAQMSSADPQEHRWQIQKHLGDALAQGQLLYDDKCVGTPEYRSGRITPELKTAISDWQAKTLSVIAGEVKPEHLQKWYSATMTDRDESVNGHCLQFSLRLHALQNILQSEFSAKEGQH